MNFQFLEDFKKLSSTCPPEHYSAKEILSFRWVFDEIIDERNFQPVFYRNPPKYLGANGKKKCDGLALSLFIGEKEAKDRFYVLENTIGRTIYKVLGTQIAQCMITEQDGVSGSPDKVGHFNHHPVVGHDYENRFEIIAKL
jgi:hypothetical protein